MAWILFVLGWWLTVSLGSLAGLLAIFAYDWFTTRRLPFARWRVKVSRDPASRVLFIPGEYFAAERANSWRTRTPLHPVWNPRIRSSQIGSSSASLAGLAGS